MQLNKSSKKTKKTADKAPVAAAPEKSPAAAAEVKPKSRTLKSSTPKKKSEGNVTASPSHHHKVSSSPAVAETRVLEQKPVEPELAQTVTVTEVVTETVTQTVTKVVTHEEIAKLAHSYWVARGHAHGSPHEDWVRAERELKPQS
jgi:hypothetical protein